jgi:ADP-ribose pyrophosphatase YjhB (NUDIX family)
MKVRELDQTTKIGAGCLFVCKTSQRILLVKRSDYVASPNTWSLPGGRGNQYETPSKTAKREVFEEINYDLTNKILRLIYTNEIYVPTFKFFTYAYLVDKEFEPKLNWESSDYIWADKHDIPQPLHWGMKQLFKNAAAMKRLSRYIKSTT